MPAFQLNYAKIINGMFKHSAIQPIIPKLNEIQIFTGNIDNSTSGIQLKK